MGYLFCENCGGYYELEKDENPEDFQSCHCNGELTYYESINHKLGKEKPFIQDKTVIQKEKYHSQLMALKYRNIELAGFFILILSFVFVFLNQIIFGIIAFLLSFYIFGEVFYKSYSWQKGADGEIQVAKFLKKMPEGYFVFNDVKIPTYQGNIDHVVIGPTGIFVIETKNYNGLFILKGNEWLYQGINGPQKARGNPGMQARRAAIELTNFLSLRGLKDIGRPHPIFTVLSGDVRIDKKPSAFKYLNPDKLVEYIINRDIKRDQDKLKAAAAILVDYSKEYTF